MLQDDSDGLVLLDELNIALQCEYLDQVLGDLQSRPDVQHVCITGRYAPTDLIELADTVTEGRSVSNQRSPSLQASRNISDGVSPMPLSL